MSRRLFTACLGTETNSFSPIPTGMGLYERTMLVRGGNHGERVSLFGLPLIEWRKRASSLGWTVVEGLAAFALPAGDTTRATHESLRDEILSDLKNAMPVDAVLLNLHGAMVANGYPDAEGNLLTRVRELIGPDIPLLAELDLHGHMTQAKLEAADCLVYYKEYPHIDAIERAHEVFDVLENMLDNGLRPTMAMHDCRMMGIYPTTREPMISFVARMQALEKKPGVLSVSMIHGFPWSDTPELGTRILVVTDNDVLLARKLANELGQWVWAERDNILAPFVSMDDAIDQVLAAPPSGKPFVLADTADNTGIGAAGDSTFVLARLLERGVGGFAISPLWDPGAVAIAFDAGKGAQLDMRIGGKLGPASGQPLDLNVTVMGLARDATQPFGGSTASMGDVAWLRVTQDAQSETSDDANAIDVIVNSGRVQAFAPACFSAAGLDPQKPRALVVKSTQHFHAGFAPIAHDIIYMSTPGSGSMDYANLPHTQVSAPLWPRVANPHAD
ncbi:MAG: M81 family metallopeptidase [Burkholderiaceae bacterium]